MFGMGIVTCGLIVINSIWVAELIPRLLSKMPLMATFPKLLQSLTFILPVLATLAQWWIIDLIQDRRRLSQPRRPS